MSPLPERRKTPEELAELRQSLGIPIEGLADESIEAENQSSPVEADDPPIPEVVEEAVEPPAVAPSEEEVISLSVEDVGEVVRDRGPRPVRSLRKSAGLSVDRPKQQISRGDSGVVPVKRHSDEEMNRIRREAQLAPPVGDVIPKVAHPIALASFYGLGTLLVLAGVIGAFSQTIPVSDLPFDWLIRANQAGNFGMVLFGILCGGAVVFLGAAGWLAWARPLSRHHAGFMTIIAVLVLVFGTLYFFPEIHGA